MTTVEFERQKQEINRQWDENNAAKKRRIRENYERCFEMWSRVKCGDVISVGGKIIRVSAKRKTSVIDLFGKRHTVDEIYGKDVGRHIKQLAERLKI